MWGHERISLAQHNFGAWGMSAVHLCRIDDARNMRRFYRLDIETDLFGGFLLMKGRRPA